MVETYTAICIQNAPKETPPNVGVDEVKNVVHNNLEKLEKMISFAVRLYDELVPPKLVALPELCLGLQSSRPKPETDKSIHYHLTIPGEETDRLGELAKKFEVYIVTSVYEKDEKYEKVDHFNTAFIISPEGKVILKYRKVNPWIPLSSALSPHDILDEYKEPLFPVVETEIGNIGCMICYDQFFPEVSRQLTFNGAEIIVKPTNFCAPWQIPPLEYFELFNRVRCIENITYGVYPNIVRRGGYGGGGSMIVDYEGRVLAAGVVGETESYIGAPISVDALRAHRKANLQNPIKQLRTEAYSYLNKTVMKPNKLLT